MDKLNDFASLVAKWIKWIIMVKMSVNGESFPSTVLMLYFSFSNFLFCLCYVWWQFQGKIEFFSPLSEGL